MGNGFLVQMIHVSEKPGISCPINGPEPGNEEFVGNICSDQPKFLPTFHHGTYVARYVAFKGAGQLSERCTLQRLRRYLFGSTHRSQEPGSRLCLEQCLVVRLSNRRPEGFDGERGEGVARRSELELIETIFDRCAEEISLIFKIVVC